MPKLFEDNEEGRALKERFVSILERAKAGLTEEQYAHIQSLTVRTFAYPDTVQRNLTEAYQTIQSGMLNMITAAAVVKNDDAIDRLERLHNIAVATARNDQRPIHQVTAA
jgi:hypothetical protein